MQVSEGCRGRAKAQNRGKTAMLFNEIAGKAATRTATYGPFAGVSADLEVGSHPPLEPSPLLSPAP
jgi:hypothetical protein